MIVVSVGNSELEVKVDLEPKFFELKQDEGKHLHVFNACGCVGGKDKD